MRILLTTLMLLPILAAPAQGQDADMQEMMTSPHITLTPHREPAPGDQARADSVVAIARRAVERYRDVAAAEADGFHRFAPQVPGQRIYHYTNKAAGLKARFIFDAASPTSLLYRPQDDGTLELIGVMYTAPASATLDELDQRIPLSVAHWHQHTSICRPPGDANPATAMSGRHPRFGPRGSIVTEADCQAAGGRWTARSFGWMVHVDVFAASRDAIWGDLPGGMRHH